MVAIPRCDRYHLQVLCLIATELNLALEAQSRWVSSASLNEDRVHHSCHAALHLVCAGVIGCRSQLFELALPFLLLHSSHHYRVLVLPRLDSRLLS